MTRGNDVAPARRPTRSEAREEVILGVAFELLAERGYEGVTMTLIAERARASKATIYRKWPDKPSLISAAIARRSELDSPTWEDDTGSLRGDLVAAVNSMVRLTVGAWGSQLLGLLEALRSDPSLRDKVRGQIAETTITADRMIFARARARGEKIRAAGTTYVFEVALASVFTRTLLDGRRPDEAYLTELVDNVLLPLALEP
ncbi:TetR/AcrR family transcriptional regulator [Amycolatopsis pithecellobii]|nr:TetR/AcrR family transcriptional regulator [Amycolatopsis pithecellobii]